MNPASASAAEDRGRKPAAGSSGLYPPASVLRPPPTDVRPPTTDHRPPASAFRASRGAAFTLVELMVAMTITTLLLLAMTGIFDQSMKAWRLSSRRADAEREVRAALATIQRDLGGLLVNSNLPIKWNIEDPAQVNIPADYANRPARAGLEGQDWSDVSGILFFASAQPARAGTPGDVAGIGYFVAWDQKANDGKGAYNLYRRFQSPAELLEGVIERLTSPAEGPYHINSIPQAEVVGANVLNFWAFMANVNPVGSSTNVTGAFPFEGNVKGTNLSARPSYVQLELTAYGSEAVRTFQVQKDWYDTNNIKKFGRSYIWRVDL